MNELMKVLKDMVIRAGSQKAVAEELGISEAYLSDILNGRKDVSDRIAAALGFEWRLVSITPLPGPEDSHRPNLVTRQMVKS
jgi:transcriptional regulator with XRE-family HTH domain